MREVCRRLRQRVPGVVFAAHVECGRRMVYEPGWPVFRGPKRRPFRLGRTTWPVALAAVARELAISPADVLVFGDMPNDISMLRWAG